MRIGDHRLTQARRTGFAFVRTVDIGGGEKGHRTGQTVHRGGKVRGRAPIDTKTGAIHIRDRFKRIARGNLYRMGRVDIFRAAPDMFVQGQKPAMFARTVVVRLTRGSFGADHGVFRVAIARHLGPTAHVVIRHAQFRQPRRNRVRMHRRALMRGTGQRQLRGPQPKRIRRATFHQGQGLNHLHRGTRQDRLIRIAQRKNDLTRMITDHHVTGMQGLGQRAAPDLNKGCRVGHANPRLFVGEFMLTGVSKIPTFALFCQISS